MTDAVAGSSVLEVVGVRKQFAGFVAVDGVSLNLRGGERRALIGPNGAGKTTLFNLLSGRLKADAGQVIYCGERIEAMPAHAICRKGIARTFQITSIFHRLTALQNVQVTLFARDGNSRRLFQWARSTKRDEAMTYLADVGLAHAHDRESGLLSYGDQKKLELAIVLAMKPRLLLLDEPTAGMEVGARREMVELVRRLCDTRRLTLLFCEHDMEAVFSIADAITVLHQGKVLAEGTPDVVRRSDAVKAIYLGTQHGLPA